MTDRFAIQDTSDGTAYSVLCDTSALQYCGGTWRGIIDHLDYIQGMGFDAIWISPPFANVEGQTPLGEAYHGYVRKRGRVRPPLLTDCDTQILGPEPERAQPAFRHSQRPEES